MCRAGTERVQSGCGAGVERVRSVSPGGSFLIQSFMPRTPDLREPKRLTSLWKNMLRMRFWPSVEHFQRLNELKFDFSGGGWGISSALGGDLIDLKKSKLLDFFKSVPNGVESM